jgi:hypothetical protein
MTVRWGMLLLATLLTVAAFEAGSAEVQPSAQRVLVTALVAVLAAVFWPGVAARPVRTALRVVVWSLAAALLAAVLLWLFGQGLQRAAGVATSCAMLLLMLLVVHGLAAVLQPLLASADEGSPGAPGDAGLLVAWCLVLLGSVPLWMGPVAELVSARHAWAVDAVIAASPLTHLAVASGNDLLRNTWLYQHANLAARPFSYPELPALVGTYTALGLGLAACLLAGPLARGRRGAAQAHPIEKEQVR